MLSKSILRELDSSQRQWVILLGSLVFGIVLMGVVSPPSSGLDPGWMFGLTKAHQEGFIWGKDIIFTYGPFSYLFFGSLIKGEFFEMQVSRYLLCVAWLFLSLQFASRLEKPIFRICAVIALVIIPSALFSYGEIQFIILEELKFIIIIQLIILEVTSLCAGESKSDGHLVSTSSNNLKLYFYGSICALLLLVKLNFGLVSIVCCSIGVGGNLIYQWIHQWRKHHQAGAIDLQEAFSKNFSQINRANWFLFGFLSGILLNFSPLAAHPFLAVILSWIPGLLLLQGSRFPQFKLFYKSPSFPILLALIGAIVSVIFGHPSIRGFLVGSLQIVSGYSQSMTLVGPDSELFGGIVLLAMIGLLTAITGLFAPQHLSEAIALCLLGLMSFKHGFTRHGSHHVLLFAASAPIYLFLLGSFMINQPRRNALKTLMQGFDLVWCFCWSLSIVFILGLGTPNTVFTKSYHLSLEHYIFLLSPGHITSQITALFQPQLTEQQILSRQTTAVTASQLSPPETADPIRSQSIDILPWSISAVAANDFQHWQPAPIFQAYSAYTRWLDAKNLASYQSNPRSHILYSFAAIDGRHPYFDQPQTTLFLICQYKPTALSQEQPSTLPEIGPTAVLEPRQQPICNPEAKQAIGQPEAVLWHEPIDLSSVRATYASETNNLLLAKIDVQYSLFGRIYSKLFRTPPVIMHVTYEQGQQRDYRVVLDTAKSGILVGNLPTDLQSSLKTFMAEGSMAEGGQDRVRTIEFSSVHPRVFQAEIIIQFERLKQQFQG